MAIEKNVPMPNRVGKGKASYWNQFEIGDSELFADKQKAYSALSSGPAKNGYKFSVRKVEGGFRVWRIE